MGRGKRYDEEPKLNIKKVISVILAIAVIVMFAISLNHLLNTETPEATGDIAYFTILENNKWGVMNSKGEVIVQPAYDEMIVIPDSTKPIFFCTYDVNFENGSYKTRVVNEKEENLFTNYETATPIDNYDEMENIFYEEEIFRVQNDGKYGLANQEGEEILKCEYDSIESLKNIENAILVTKNGQYGLASGTGDLIIEPNYKEIKPLGKKYSDGYIVVNQENQYGIIDSNKRTVLETKYEDIKNVHGNNLYVVKENGNWKIIDRNGEEKSTIPFDEISEINGETLVIQRDGKWGTVGLDGTVKVNVEYDELKWAFGENYIAKKEDKYGIVNEQNEVVLPFEYISLNYRSDANFIQAEKTETETIVLDNTFQEKIVGILSEVNTEKGYIRARVGDEYKYYNFRLEEKIPQEVLTNHTLFLSIKDGKYGFVDKDGKVIVDYQYDDATEQNDYGYAAVKKDGKWGSINQEGKVVLEPSVELENNLIIDFIGQYHLAEDLNMYYYCK